MKNHALAVIGNTPLRHDKDGLISLTDIYQAATAQNLTEGKCQPGDWAREAGAQFIEFVAENLHTRKTGIYKTSRARSDRGGGTFAHWQIALAYAKYLSPELHMQVNEAYMRFRTNDISMADEITDKATPEQQEWLLRRLQGKAVRRGFTDTLQAHGVIGSGYGQCTHAIHKPILGGSKKAVCHAKGLDPAKTNLRDQMSMEELIATSMSELVASKSIIQSGVQGNTPCAHECRRAAESVAALLN